MDIIYRSIVRRFFSRHKRNGRDVHSWPDDVEYR